MGFISESTCVCVLVAQSCPTLCNPMDCSPSGSSVHRILQAGVLEWVPISFSRRPSRPRDQTQVSSMVGRCFTIGATKEVPVVTHFLYLGSKIIVDGCCNHEIRILLLLGRKAMTNLTVLKAETLL